jgi:serine phosphatase RsbU (regulator of sigma subunit)
VLVSPTGVATLLTTPPDLLLGLNPGTSRATHTADLEPGGTFLLYTDGLVERRGESLDAGLERQRAAAEGAHSLSPEDLCDVLLARLPPDGQDDVALLALRVPG